MNCYSYTHTAYFLIFFFFLLSSTSSCAQKELFKKKDKTSVKNQPQNLTDTLKIISDTISKPRFRLKENYKVALMLPFYLDSIDKADELYQSDDYLIMSEKSDSVIETQLPVIYKGSKLAVSFYQGVLVAIDSLKRAGLNMTLNVYDTQNDTTLIKKLLEKKELQTMELIVGPVYNNDIHFVSAFAEKNKIPMVSPLSTSLVDLNQNPFFMMSNPTLQTQCEKLAEFAFNHSTGQNIMMIKEQINKETKTASVFKNKYNQLFRHEMLNSKLPMKHGILKEFAYAAAGNKELLKYLSDSLINVIFIPSVNEAFVSSLLYLLGTKSANCRIVILGLPGWEKFETIGIDLLQSLQVHIPSAFHINYDSLDTKNFRQKFRTQFYTEPDMYAYHGYDEMMLFGSSLLKNGNNFMNGLENAYQGLHNVYSYKRNNSNSGYENKGGYVLKFQDFSLIKVE